MRRVLWAILLAVAILPLWAEGTAEPLGKLVLALDAQDGILPGKIGLEKPGLHYYVDWVAPQFEKRTGRKLEVREIVASGGATTTIDMVLASGERLDAIAGYAGRMSKWATPAWALPLSDYIPPSELAKFVPGALEPYYRSGKLYALPATAWLQGININLRIVREIGMEDKLPKTPWEPWAMADFMEMAKRAKAKGYYAMPLFATQPSGDYWVQVWMTGFGAELWRDGKVVLDSPAGREAVAWLVSMQEYAPPGAAGLDYNVIPNNWKAGKILASGGAPTGWATDDPWRFILPPSLPGKTGKVIMGPDSSLVFQNTKEPRLAVELMLLLSGPEAQGLWCESAGRYTTHKLTPVPVAWGSGEGKDFIGVRQDAVDRWANGMKMVQTAGVWDAGIPNSAYSKVREGWLVMLQSLFLGRATVGEAVAKFQKDANAFIEAQ
jgi:ABC-type glycerol-3-phosphate transport system substrate-binding protein